MSVGFAGSSQSLHPLDLRLLVDAIPALAWSSLPGGAMEFVNLRCQAYTGLPPEEWYSSGWKAAVHPADLTELLEKWGPVPNLDKPRECEVRLRGSNGTFRRFLLRREPWCDKNGDIVRWYGTGIDIEDLRRGEPTQRASEQTFRLIVDGIAGLVATMTAEGEVENVNRQVLEYFGKTLEDLKGWTTSDAVHPSDLPQAVAAWKHSAETGDPYDVDHRLRRADGVYRWFHSRGLPLRDSEGRIVRWCNLLTDIDERKKALDGQDLLTQELRRREAYLAEAQRLSQSGSFGWEPHTGEIVWSDETYRIFEYDKASTPTLDMVLQRVHPDDTALVRQVTENASKTAIDFEHKYRLLMPSGAIKHVHVRAHCQRRGSSQIEFIGAVTDITERMLAEGKIRDQEAELQHVLDLTPQFVAVFGPNRERLYINRVGLDYLGITLDEWLGRRNRTEIHPDDREQLKTSSNQAAKRGLVYELEARIGKADGSYRWFLGRYNPVRDEKGQITRWYVACTDIDDRKQAEDRLRNENVALREEIEKTSMFEEIIGTSSALRTVLSRVSQVAPTDSTVLITGDTGTGKELIARRIHRRSNRGLCPFVSVNCAAIPRDLIASELFGHEKGAFTGATERRMGRFELADGGTIFLDEVAELLAETQVALLRVLQEREFERVGGAQPIRVDVRIIAATNWDLGAAVAKGIFREELFYRLNVFPITLPPLRERKDDILMLVEYFVQRYATKAGKHIRSVDKRTLDLLQSYDWPGNIRELQNVIERSVILAHGDVFSVDELWLSNKTSHPRSWVETPRSAPRMGEARTEREIIEQALAETRGRVSGPSGAAAKLGIPASTLATRIKTLKINKRQFKFRSG
jgi:PAS domain S-box-containing protein